MQRLIYIENLSDLVQEHADMSFFHLLSDFASQTPHRTQAFAVELSSFEQFTILELLGNTIKLRKSQMLWRRL